MATSLLFFIFITMADQSSDDRMFNHYLKPYHRAEVITAEATWRFQPDQMQGLRLEITSSGKVQEALILRDCGKILAIVAVARPVEHYEDRTMAALGLATLNADGTVAYSLCTTGRLSIETPDGWACSNPLISREKSNVFNLMAVAIPEGDSTVLTLQRLRRGGVEERAHDQFEIHQFVNHCPMGKRNEEGRKFFTDGTFHYFSVQPVEDWNRKPAPTPNP